MKFKFTALLLSLLSCVDTVSAQSTTASNTWAPLRYLGYTNPGHLNFRTSGLLRMRLGSANGFLGIGPNALLPANLIWRLNVDDNINVNPTLPNFMDGYRMYNQRFLFMPGGPTAQNTFVGIAGDPAGFFGNNNTVIGFGSGGNMSNACITAAHSSVCVGAFSGYELGGAFITCIGFRAGYKVGDGDLCTFVGGFSGENATCTANNSFFGARSGQNLISGNQNTFVGFNAGFSANGGHMNTILGINGGSGLGSGSNNILIGPNTGANLLSNNNIILIGNNSDINSPSGGPITNSVTLGDNTIVTSDNKMILGNDPMWVGIGLSNDLSATFGPGNSLEINARNNTTGAIIPNASGLRFRQLTANSPTVPNQGNQGFLALNTNGDVIYVPAPTGTGCCIGNVCGSTPNNLNTNWEIPMVNGVNYMFNETLLGGGSEVGIGHTIGTCANIFGGKFEVVSTINHRFAGAFRNTANIPGQNTIGVGGSASSTADDAIGVRGQCLFGANNGVSRGIGVVGLSVANSGCSFNVGVGGIGEHGASLSLGGGFEVTNVTSPVNVGVGGVVGGNVIAMVSGLPPGTTIGVYGGNTFPGNPTSPGGPNWAGYFDGDLNVNGFSYTTIGNWSGSDERFKQDIKPLQNVMEKINKLNGYTYKFKQEEFKQRNFDDAQHIGLLAQQLKEVFPELVREDKSGYYAVNYQGMVPVLLEAIKEQQRQIEELRSMMVVQNSNQGGANHVTTTLSDKDIVVLDQNVPNPFAEQTVITFNLPENTGKAQMLFYNIEGKLINSVDLIQKGRGQLTVFANDLSNGIYTYALVVDGKVMDTKKMQKQK